MPRSVCNSKNGWALQRTATCMLSIIRSVFIYLSRRSRVGDLVSERARAHLLVNNDF